MGFLVTAILLVFLFGFIKLHKQNEQVIGLSKEIKDK